MTITTPNLKDAIAAAMPAVGKPRGIPVLSCFHLSSQGKQLAITGNNLDQRIVAITDCDGQIEPVCVSARNLETLANISNGTVNLSHVKGRVKFESGTTRADLPAILGEEFPSSKGLEKLKPQGVNCQDLAKAIKAVAWTTSDVEAEHILRGVYIEGTPKTLTAMASNRRRIAHYSLPSVSASFDALIPGKVCTGLVQALGQDGAVFAISENHAAVQHEHGEFSCSLSEGVFPSKPITGMIELKPVMIGQVQRGALLSAMEAVMKLSTEDMDVVVLFEFTPTQLQLDFKNKDSEGLSMSIPGKFEPLKVEVNARSFLPCLEQLETELLPIEFNKDINSLRIVSGNLTIIMTTMAQAKKK